jgi:hypothetical protein
MRHLGSVLLSMALAPIIWVGAGMGLSKFSEGVTGDSDYLAAFVGLIALGLAGLGYAALLLTRLSPVGPVLTGLAFFGATMWLLFGRSSFTSTMPDGVLGVAGAGHIPAAGLAALLAVPLLATVVSPRRWRRYDRVDAGTYPTVYGSPARHSPPATYPPPPPAYPPVYEPDDTKPLPPGG